MLTQLSIKNYAIIDDLNVNFEDGFTVITGETGAGKSILLEGLSMVLGKRADLNSLRDKTSKCIIEAQFNLTAYELQSFFETNDLDYDGQTIVRREILPSGKSRAFINDSPVTLEVLTGLGGRLIDVHSQHQTLLLAEHDFQLKIIDAIAGNSGLLKEYQSSLATYKHTASELNELMQQQQNAIKDQDYNSFLLNELENTPLKEGMQEDLEGQYEQLNNVETILSQLSAGYQLLQNESTGILSLLYELKLAVGKLTSFGSAYEGLNERIQSLHIEADDIASEMQSLEGSVETDPSRLEEINGILQSLFDLKKKHGATTVNELLEIRDELRAKVDQTEHLDEDIATKQQLLAKQEGVLMKLAEDLNFKRQAAIPELVQQLEEDLATLGMPHATFKISLEHTTDFETSGRDRILFLLSSNKGTDYGQLKKVASGGELSRIMLVIKSVLAQHEKLPTLMFDEIDTGVSGEISNKMADIMRKMSKHMQVFAITHLPQVASKGDHHYKVYKEDSEQMTRTEMKWLSTDERIVELAEMLGGKELSDSALAHARQLLN